MAIENGSDFLLKVGDGEAPPTYRTVAGLRTTQLSVNGEAVNVTTKDSGGWRELLAVGGRRLILRPSFAALVAAAFPGFDIRMDHDRHANHVAVCITATCRRAGPEGGDAQ